MRSLDSNGKKYLVSIDGTESGHKAFATALEQSTNRDHIFLLSVAVANYVTKADERVKNDCKLQLSKYGNILTEKQIPHTLLLGKGNTKELIVEEAKAKDIDMIFLGRVIPAKVGANRTLSSMLKAPDTCLYVVSYAPCSVRLCTVSAPSKESKKKLKLGRKVPADSFSPPTSPRDLSPSADTIATTQRKPKIGMLHHTHTSLPSQTREKIRHKQQISAPSFRPMHSRGFVQTEQEKRPRESPPMVLNRNSALAKKRSHKRVLSDGSGPEFSPASERKHDTVSLSTSSPHDLHFAAEAVPLSTAGNIKLRKKKKRSESAMGGKQKAKKTHKRTASDGSGSDRSYQPAVTHDLLFSSSPSFAIPDGVERKKKRGDTAEKPPLVKQKVPKRKHKRVLSDGSGTESSIHVQERSRVLDLPADHDLLFALEEELSPHPRLNIKDKKQAKHKNRHKKEKLRHSDKMKQKALELDTHQEETCNPTALTAVGRPSTSGTTIDSVSKVEIETNEAPPSPPSGGGTRHQDGAEVLIPAEEKDKTKPKKKSLKKG